MVDQASDSEKLHDILRRITRIETRLCQLMTFLGCVPESSKNVQERKPSDNDARAN